MKKKILSLMLAMVMMLSLSVTALAADNPDEDGNYADESTLTIEKKLEYEGSDSTVSVPDATFYFTITSTDTVQYASSDVTAPTINNGSFTISTKDGEGTKVLTLPAIDIGGAEGTDNAFTSVGVYSYIIEEVTPNGTNGVYPVAGVTYSTTEYLLQITVVYNEEAEEYVRVIAVFEYTNGQKGEKQDTEGSDTSAFDITNTYDAHSLTVHKDVAGKYGDKTDSFSFKVTFTAPNDYDWDASEIDVPTSATLDEENSTETVRIYTFSLSHGDEITFGNIPDEVSYTVEETLTDDQSNYEQDMSSNSTTDDDTTDGEGTFDGENITETVTNTRGGDVDTGVSLDSLPYILMLIVVAAGVVVIISRRRLDNRF